MTIIYQLRTKEFRPMINHFSFARFVMIYYDIEVYRGYGISSPDTFFYLKERTHVNVNLVYLQH
jgi:hypothetical protein